MFFTTTLSCLLLLVVSLVDSQLFLPAAPSPPLGPTDPDAEMTITQLVHDRGFSLEVHTVVTEDGYLLTLHRLMPRHYHGRNYSLNRKPIIIQHGLFGASTDFLINSPYLKSPNSTTGDNFGFGLLLTGRYDVWLANSRGNEYSQQHVKWRANGQTLEMEQSEYWEFSFDQIARYDLPVVVDKVKSVTGWEKIAYLGYSQGATAMFALLSRRPEYASTIHPFITWAPVVYMSNISSPFRFLAPVTELLRHLGNRFAPSSHLLSTLSHPLCKLSPLEALCTNALFLFGGFDTEHLNRTRLPVYFHFTPATASTWQVVHYLQMIATKRFAQFDHGSVRNTELYGSPLPPEYPLATIPSNLPIVIIRSQNDYLSSIPDTDRLIAELKNRSSEAAGNVLDYVVPDPIWAHLDFPLGTDAGRLVYDQTVAFLDRFL